MSRLWVLLAVVSSSLIAQADSPPTSAQQKEADELFQAGRQLLTDGKNDEACAKFDEAIKIDPTADGVMLNLGLCNEKRGKYKSALYWFRKAQFRATEKKLPDNERVAREHTTDLATKVATVKVVLEGNAANAKVRIDGEVIQPDDYGHIEVDPEHHVLEAGAPGMKNVHQEFDIKGQGGDTLTISFIAGDNTIVRDPGKGRRMAAVYVAIGGGALMLAAGGVSLYEKSQWSKVAVNDMKPTTDAGIDAANHAHDIARTYGTGLFIAGAVAVSAAAYLYFTAPEKEVIDQTVFAPTLTPDGVGVAAIGRF